ncbi:MAG: hypothetical protein IPL61_25160 [Myxococcales bacterium]|nr:hypothetical protein [Myxococcales bacterium]
MLLAHKGQGRTRLDRQFTYDVVAGALTCAGVAAALLGSAHLLERDFLTKVPLAIALATLVALVVAFVWFGKAVVYKPREAPAERVLRTRADEIVAVGLVTRRVHYATYGGPPHGDEHSVRIVLADGSHVEGGDTVLGTATTAIREALARRGVVLTRQAELFPTGGIRV